MFIFSNGDDSSLTETRSFDEKGKLKDKGVASLGSEDGSYVELGWMVVLLI